MHRQITQYLRGVYCFENYWSWAVQPNMTSDGKTEWFIHLETDCKCRSAVSSTHHHDLPTASKIAFTQARLILGVKSFCLIARYVCFSSESGGWCAEFVHTISYLEQGCKWTWTFSITLMSLVKMMKKNWLQTNPLWIERCFEYWGLVLVSVYGGYSFLKSIGYMS